MWYICGHAGSVVDCCCLYHFVAASLHRHHYKHAASSKWLVIYLIKHNIYFAAARLLMFFRAVAAAIVDNATAARANHEEDDNECNALLIRFSTHKMLCLIVWNIQTHTRHTQFTLTVEVILFDHFFCSSKVRIHSSRASNVLIIFKCAHNQFRNDNAMFSFNDLLARSLEWKMCFLIYHFKSICEEEHPQHP